VHFDNVPRFHVPGGDPRRVGRQRCYNSARAEAEHYSHKRADNLDLFILPPVPARPKTQPSSIFPQHVCPPALYVDVDQHRLPDALYLGDDAFEIKGLREDDLEDLLHVY